MEYGGLVDGVVMVSLGEEAFFHLKAFNQFAVDGEGKGKAKSSRIREMVRCVISKLVSSMTMFQLMRMIFFLLDHKPYKLFYFYHAPLACIS